MRKPALLFALIVLFAIPLKSQNIVMHAGAGISSMTIKYFDNHYITDRFPIFAPDFGLGYEVYLNRRISIKPGIAYSRHGKVDITDFGSGVYLEEKYTINYIDFPVLFAYNFNTRSTWGYTLNISAGPYIGVGFNGVITTDTKVIVEEKKIFVGESGIERNDFGFIFRVGFGYTRDQIAASLVLGIKNLAITGGDFTEFRRSGISICYIRNMDFGPNAIRMIKKRFF